MNESQGRAYLARTVVPSSRGALATLGATSGVMGLFWLWLSFVALKEGDISGWVVFPAALAIAFGCGVVCWWALKRRANEEPAMIIDEAGLYDNVSIIHGGRLKWRNLERVWVTGPTWMQFLCVLPEDIHAFLDNQQELKGAAMRLNQSLFGAPIVIPMIVLEMPQEDVWHRMVQIAGASRPPNSFQDLAASSR